MPVYRWVPQDPTDLVLEGEQLRSEALASGNNFSVWPDPIPLSFVPPVFDEEDYFPPMQCIAYTVDSRVQSAQVGMIRANAGIACGQFGVWLPVFAHECLAQTMDARPGAWTRYSLSGVSLDSSSNPLGTCVVKVFLTGNDVKQFETVSDASGNWSIDVGANPGPFYLVEYKTGSPDRAGTSLNTNVPTATQ